MIRLDLLEEHSHLHSSSCSRCPQGRAGCCESPPAIAWADMGRLVVLGEKDFLVAEIRAGNLRPCRRGLVIRRVEPQKDEQGTWPRKCVYLGPTGCVLGPNRRSATCNYYLCDEAFAQAQGQRGGEVVARARAAHRMLEALYGRWDLELGGRVGARFAQGPTWDEAFWQWLGDEYRRLTRQSRGELRRLAQPRKRQGE